MAKALEIQFGDPVLFVERQMFADGPHPFEVVRSFYRADVYRYQIRLKRSRKAPFRWRLGERELAPRPRAPARPGPRGPRGRASGGGTQVTLTSELTVGGMLGALGHKAIAAKSREIGERFAQALRAELQGPGASSG